MCFGEEISWGQRIFGWNTPESWAEISAQKETTFHNLWLFQTTNSGGSRKSFLGLFLNMSRLFSIFWLVYCVFIPVVNRYSRIAKSLFDQVSLPICPLWISFLFLTNYLAFHSSVSIYSDLSHSVYGSLNELKETNYAFIFMVFAIYEFIGLKRNAGFPV